MISDGGGVWSVMVVVVGDGGVWSVMVVVCGL